MNSLNIWLDRNKDLGVFILRLFIGARLIYGVIDNVFSWEHMIKFRDFLQLSDFPVPMVCAIISVYAQLLAGIMIVIGLKIRLASAFMIINFLVAIVMVHRSDTVERMTPVLAILFCCVLFLFQGAGKYSTEGKRKIMRVV
jgi:putative oxidoreductase